MNKNKNKMPPPFPIFEKLVDENQGSYFICMALVSLIISIVCTHTTLQLNILCNYTCIIITYNIRLREAL